MRQIKLPILTFCLSLVFYNCKGQKTDNSKMIVESISYYSELKSTGLTTASASSQFKKLENDNATKKIISDAPLELITEVFNKSEKKRHIQKKLGTKMIFTLITIDGVVHKCLLSKDVILDFNTYTEYWIRNDEQRKGMEKFILELISKME